MKSYTPIRAPQMNANALIDHVTFSFGPSSAQNFSLSSALIYEQIPAKAITFPSALAVFRAY